ncbi:MAG TPA: ABC transporter substrate-binding protein [Nitriliruptoraceae bacterium]|nr:ABC transporter substrate-binding protein [Nitriliruptoraceae bacterium]
MRISRAIALGAVSAMLLAGCTTNVYEEGAFAGGGGGDAADAAGGGGGGGNEADNTGQVLVSGANTGVEGAALQEIYDTYVNEAQDDFTVTYSGSDGFEQEVILQIEGGTPPDVASFPQPGAVIEQAEQGNLVALEDLGYDIEELNSRFGEYLVSLGEYDGKHYGIPDLVNFKSAVWYNVPAFEEGGYETPETWDELIALSDQMVADGLTPWCLGTGSDAATGWPGTDWIEDITLRQAGVDDYDAWVNGELPFSSDSIKRSWELFGDIIFTDGYVLGGANNISGNDFRDAPDPMFQDPPQCMMHRQATFITNFFPGAGSDDELTAGEDYDFFPFPDIDGNSGALMAGQMLAIFRNAPEVKEYLDLYTAQEPQCALGTIAGISFISPRLDVGEDCYDNIIIAQAAGTLNEALNSGVARFDGSDLMPPEVGSGEFWNSMNNYTDSGPDNLDDVLASIDAAFGN